ncbi:MAG: NifU family protein [Xanthomonadales bacterium]|nr:NifU family protein [Xanthomonadales bacterium]
MIEIHASAQEYFKKLIDGQDIPGLGLRLAVSAPGTPQAECELSFCEPEDSAASDQVQSCEGFDLYVDGASAPYLEEAEIEFVTDRTGGQLVVRAPNIKGSTPDDDSPLAERVQYLLDSEINPAVAAHGGRVSLVEVDADGYVVLEFGGGCHGCGMVNVTLKEGVEKTLKAQLPEIAGVRDVTDHSTGENPYFS